MIAAVVIVRHAVNVSAPNAMKATARAMSCGMDQCVVKPLKPKQPTHYQTTIKQLSNNYQRQKNKTKKHFLMLF